MIGQLELVTEVEEGSSLSADVTAGGLLLPVENADDFVEPCLVEVAGESYLCVDVTDAEELVLDPSTPLVANLAAADEWAVYALSNTGRDVRRYAHLRFDDDGDTIPCLIPTSLYGYFRIGEADAGALVEVEPSGMTYEVSSRPFDEASFDGGTIDPGTLPTGGSGQTFSPDPPSSTEGFAEDHAWWQVVDGKVVGFWRLTGGVWTPAEIVTSEALQANNALITALQTVDLSTVNLSAVNIDGGSIAIATSTASSNPQAFAGTSLPAGWTAAVSASGGYVMPTPSVTATPPSGGTGSALLLDTGTSGQSAGSATGTVVTSYIVGDFEVLFKYKPNLQGGLLPPSVFAVDVCGNADWSNAYVINTGWNVSAQPTVQFAVKSSGSETSVSGADMSAAWDPTAWYWVRCRKVAGTVRITLWKNGATEPAAKTAQVTTVHPAGNVRLRSTVNTFSGTSDGQKFYVDQFDVTGISTGFQVNPDGTGAWPGLFESLPAVGLRSTTTNQTFATSGSWGVVSLTGATSFSRGAITVASSVATLGESGVYALSAVVCWDNNATGRRLARIEAFTSEAAGAGTTLAAAEAAAATGVFATLNPSTDVYLAAGTKVRLVALQTTSPAASVDLRNNSVPAQLNIRKVG